MACVITPSPCIHTSRSLLNTIIKEHNHVSGAGLFSLVATVSVDDIACEERQELVID